MFIVSKPISVRIVTMNLPPKPLPSLFGRSRRKLHPLLGAAETKSLAAKQVQLGRGEGDSIRVVYGKFEALNC